MYTYSLIDKQKETHFIANVGRKGYSVGVCMSVSVFKSFITFHLTFACHCFRQAKDSYALPYSYPRLCSTVERETKQENIMKENNFVCN